MNKKFENSSSFAFKSSGESFNSSAGTAHEDDFRMKSIAESKDFKIDRLTEIVMNSENGESFTNIFASRDEAEKRVRESITQGINGENNAIYGVALNLAETHDVNLARNLSQCNQDFGNFEKHQGMRTELDLMDAQNGKSSSDVVKKAFAIRQRDALEEELASASAIKTEWDSGYGKDDSIPDLPDNPVEKVVTEDAGDDEHFIENAAKKKVKEKIDLKKLEKKHEKLDKSREKFDAQHEKVTPERHKLNSKGERFDPQHERGPQVKDGKSEFDKEGFKRVQKEKLQKKSQKLSAKADKYDLKSEKASKKAGDFELKKNVADGKTPIKHTLTGKKKLKMGQRNLRQKLIYQSLHQPKDKLKNAVKRGSHQDGHSYDNDEVVSAAKRGKSFAKEKLLKPLVRKHTALGFDRQQYKPMKFEKKGLKFDKKSVKFNQKTKKNAAKSAFANEIAENGVKGSNPISRAWNKHKIKARIYSNYGYKKTTAERIKELITKPVEIIRKLKSAIVAIMGFFSTIISNLVVFLQGFGMPLFIIILLAMFTTFFSGLFEEDDRVTLTRESAIYVNYVASLEHNLVSAVNNNKDWDKKEKDSDTGLFGFGAETMWDYSSQFPNYDDSLFGEEQTNDGYGTSYTKGDVCINGKSLLTKAQRTDGENIWNPEYTTYTSIGKGDFPSIDAINSSMNQVKFIAYVTAKYTDDLTPELCRTEARNILYGMYTVHEDYSDIPSQYYKYYLHEYVHDDGSITYEKEVQTEDYTYHKLNLSITQNCSLDDYIKANLDPDVWDLYQLYTGIDLETDQNDGSGTWGLGQLIVCPLDLGGTDWRTKVSSLYGTRTIGALHYEMERDAPEFHKGIDIGCAVGTPLIAGADGTVTSAGYNEEGGYVINLVIQDPGTDDGSQITLHYVHCSEMYVSEGQAVTEGQVIGLSGATGSGAGASGATDSNDHYISDGRAHLHFSMYLGGDTGGSSLNPLFYIELPE